MKNFKEMLGWIKSHCAWKVIRGEVDKDIKVCKHDDIVVTDLSREKAKRLALKLSKEKMKSYMDKVCAQKVKRFYSRRRSRGV